MAPGRAVVGEAFRRLRLCLSVDVLLDAPNEAEDTLRLPWPTREVEDVKYPSFGTRENG